jgi:hydrophobe/amphiphile efflux-1 (HAE1) family protein
MNMQLSTWAIKNPIPPIVFFLVLTVAGLYSFFQMPVNNMPSVVVPIVSVDISQPGAAAAEVETQITRRVEGAIAGLQGVKNITSTISEGSSSTVIEFHLETDFDRAVNDTRDAISNIRDQLPRSILEPNIRRIEVDGGAILIYTVEAPELRTEELSWFIDDTLSRELLSIRGVASVSRQGGVDHEITVTLDPAKLSAYGITAADISRQLAQTNINLPGGRVTLAGSEYTIRTLGNATSVDELKEIQIAISGARYVKLSDIATITDGGAEERSITRLNGKPAITFSVFRSKGSSEVTVAKKVKEKIAEIEDKKSGFKFKEIFSLVTFTEISFKSAIYTFFEGALLTILVVFLFLRDRRATVIAALAIPLSIIPTFLFMHMLGFSLNAVSLLAISLVTGVLVDDAIVEIENIHRHMKEGKSPYEASIIAAEEIGLAVVATTMVICAVFFPVSFMPGIVGQFFIQFGLTVVLASFFSLVVARLLTPMLCAYLLKDADHAPQKTKPRWLQKYASLVNWTLNNRLKTLGIAALSLILSFSMIPFLSSGFIPYEDYSQSRLSIELPRGSTPEQTDAAAQKIADILTKYKEVQYVLTSVSGASSGMSAPNTMGGGNSGINEASIDIKLVPPNERKMNQKEFESMVLPELKKIPDIRINFANSSGATDISIALVSDNGDVLEETARAVEREMRAMPELSSVSTTASLKQPEIIIIPNYAKAAAAGVSVQSISDTVNIATIGDIESNLAKFNYGNRQIPIRVRLPDTEIPSLDTIRNLKLPTTLGSTVPLSAIAEIKFSNGPTVIERYQRQRKIALEANLNNVPLGEAIEKIYALPSMQNLPKDVKVQNTGDAEMMQELFAGFMGAIFAGLMMVYAIQVLLYKDWIQPFTRMAALPLSIGGAFFALLITGTDLSLPAVIGLLMLMGIADKNSILLVDYMLELIHKGMPRREAIMEACMVRAKPIIMTSLAMLAGMFPIALGIGLDTAFRAPMAIAVIGGLISSTALSLIFVPVLFSYVRDFEEWALPKLKQLIS